MDGFGSSYFHRTFITLGPAFNGTAPLGLQPHFGDNLLKKKNPSTASPKRDCSPKEVKVGPSHRAEECLFIDVVLNESFQLPGIMFEA